MAKEQSPMSQREIAEVIAPIVNPWAYDFDKWSKTVSDIRYAYGEEAGDNYQMRKDYELHLMREGRYGEFVLQQLGVEPPYEITVPIKFPWLKIGDLLKP